MKVIEVADQAAGTARMTSADRPEPEVALDDVLQVNAAWVLAVTLAADLDAWTRLFLLHDEPELARAEPQTLRMKLYHLSARLTTHARQRTLYLDRNWPQAAAFTTAWQRATQLPALT